MKLPVSYYHYVQCDASHVGSLLVLYCHYTFEQAPRTGIVMCAPCKCMCNDPSKLFSHLRRANGIAWEPTCILNLEGSLFRGDDLPNAWGGTSRISLSPASMDLMTLPNNVSATTTRTCRLMTSPFQEEELVRLLHLWSWGKLQGLMILSLSISNTVVNYLQLHSLSFLTPSFSQLTFLLHFRLAWSFQFLKATLKTSRTLPIIEVLQFSPI